LQKARPKIKKRKKGTVCIAGEKKGNRKHGKKEKGPKR